MFYRAQHTNGLQQNSRIRNIVAALMPAALLATPHPVRAQNAKAIIQKMIATYQGMNSYVGRSNTDQRLADPNGKVFQEAGASVILTFKKPTRLKLEFTTPAGGQNFYDDGAKITYFSSGTKSYFQEPSAPKFRDVLSQLDKLGIKSAMDTLFFLGVDSLPNNLTNITLAGSKMSNGRPVYIVTASISAGSSAKDANNRPILAKSVPIYMTWWIDKQTSLLSFVETRIPNIPQKVYIITTKGKTKTRVQKIINSTLLIRENIIDPKPNAAVDDKEFVFTPPAGSKEVQNAQQLLQKK